MQAMIIGMAIAAALVGVVHQALSHKKMIDLSPARPSSSHNMSALAYETNGDSSVLKFFNNSHPRPVLNPNQILIKVHFSSLNPVDIKLRRNRLPGFLFPKPRIPGEDVAGIVVETGDRVTKFKIGDRVAAMMPLIATRWGSSAEFAAVEEGLVGKVADTTDLAQAASIPLAGLTAITALRQVQNPTDKRILIHAGAGGVGTIAIQYAKSLGMHVIATASQSKAELLKSLGCDEVIDYRNQRFEDVLNNQPVDVILDPMSWKYEARTFSSNVLKEDGHYLNIPSSGWQLNNGIEDIDLSTTLKNLAKSLVLPSKIKYTVSEMHPNGDLVQQLLDLLESGALRAVIDRVYNLTDAALAHDYLEEGHTTGKIVFDHRVV